MADEVKISIHAAQEGCDCTLYTAWLVKLVFQSTQPKRAATADGCSHSKISLSISIHAAQEGCDHKASRKQCCAARNFNPRSPRGLRLNPVFKPVNESHFNPRSPRGLRQEPVAVDVSAIAYFNPRSPRGLRLARWLLLQAYVTFQSTQPKRAATW